MFFENGYNPKTLQNIINNFEKKARSINSNNKNSTNQKQAIASPWIPKIGRKIKK